MKLELRRRFLGDSYTVGSLYIDGKYFCDTLEDKVRDLPKEKKVMHETAIPKGTYKVIVNASPRFKRKLPRLLNVPYFEGILIHAGNIKEHTSGCILVGENKVKGAVINSKKYEEKIVKVLEDAQNRSEDISITIK